MLRSQGRAQGPRESCEASWAGRSLSPSGELGTRDKDMTGSGFQRERSKRLSVLTREGGDDDPNRAESELQPGWRQRAVRPVGSARAVHAAREPRDGEAPQDPQRSRCLPSVCVSRDSL